MTIYQHPEKKRYRTGIDLKEEEWKKLNTPRLKDDNLKEIKVKDTTPYCQS